MLKYLNYYEVIPVLLHSGQHLFFIGFYDTNVLFCCLRYLLFFLICFHVVSSEGALEDIQLPVSDELTYINLRNSTKDRDGDYCFLCQAAPKKKKSYLSCCGKPVHMKCWKAYSAHKKEEKQQISCPYCRNTEPYLITYQLGRWLCCPKFGCISTFRSRKNLERHKHALHTFCFACNREISLLKWEDHTNHHPFSRRTKLYKCNKCNQLFRSGESLNQHVLYMHSLSIVCEPPSKLEIVIASETGERSYTFETGYISVLETADIKTIKIAKGTSIYQCYSGYYFQCGLCSPKRLKGVN